MIEALCRAKFKFPGRQKIHISNKWRFTKFNKDEFENMVAEKQLTSDGCGVKYPTQKKWPCTQESLGTVPFLHLPTHKPYFPVQRKEREEG